MFITNEGSKEIELCIMSYNSRGFGVLKQNFCRYLSSKEVVGNKIPILCNQGHFILRGNSYKLKQAFPDSFLLINPAEKSTHCKGRARGGLVISVPEYFKNNIQDVSPGYWRLQAALIQAGGSTILLINTYFPVDERAANIDETELDELFQNIRNMIENNSFTSFILCGDINCDFLRNTGHVKAVQTFIEEFSLTKSWEEYPVDFTHYQENQGNSYTAILDHFFWCEKLSEKILDAGVIHSPENASDHCPVFCVIKSRKEDTIKNKSNQKISKPSWSKASADEKEAFRHCLETKLHDLHIPECLKCCRDVHCRDTDHLNIIDSFISQLLGIVEQEARENLPIIQNKSFKKKPKPGWSELVKPFRETALFWSQVWKSAGCPQNTVLHNIMKRSRNIYHYEYRKCSRSKELIRKNKILDSCINGDGDLFEEIKAMRKCNQVVATTMDGVTQDIPGHFRNVYENLYNSHEDLAQIADIKAEVNAKINSFHLVDVDKVTPEIVKEAALHLNSNKSDPTYTFSSDCIKNGPDSLFQHLSVVLKSFLIHGHVTLFLLIATLVPIIKDKLGSISSSKNYRSIALSSQVLKLFDWVILLLFGESLGVDQLQFAYQPGASTTMCTWAAVETISFFLRNGSEVYTCLMDMTKAFDLVRFSTMFRKILCAGLSVIFVRLLIFIYANQFANVRWNGIFSDFFKMQNGVRQGAVLSAFFYCIYMNDLFKILRKSKLGCWVNGEFCGIYGYSDDNYLLAPSLHALQEMLLICEEYARDHDLKFSTDPNPKKCKTKCIAFLKKRRDLPELKLCGNNLPWVESGKHLGVNLNDKNDGLKYDMKIKRAQYIIKNNELSQEFKFCHPVAQFHLNEVYNSSFPGSPLWNLFCRESEMIENSWNTSCRIMFDLPLSTHRYFIQPVSNKMHLKNILMKRFLSFLSQIKRSNKKVPSFLLNMIKYDVRSTTGYNLRNMMLLFNKNQIEDIEEKDIIEYIYAPVEENDAWKVQIVKELIDVKNDELSVVNMSKEEVDFMIESLCTS